MNKAYKDYLIKGWHVRASEYYNDWEIQLNLEDIKEWENFVNTENIRFNTLKECKKWIKSKDAEELKNKYIK